MLKKRGIRRLPEITDSEGDGVRVINGHSSVVGETTISVHPDYVAKVVVVSLSGTRLPSMESAVSRTAEAMLRRIGAADRAWRRKVSDRRSDREIAKKVAGPPIELVASWRQT